MKHLSLIRLTGLVVVSMALYGMARADAPRVIGDCADCYTPLTQEKATQDKGRLKANPSIVTGEQSTAEDVHGLTFIVPGNAPTPSIVAPAAAAITAPSAAAAATPEATTPSAATTPAAAVATSPAATSPAAATTPAAAAATTTPATASTPAPAASPQASGPMTRAQAMQILSTGIGNVAAAQAAYYGPGGYYSQSASVQAAAAAATITCNPASKTSPYPVPVMTSNGSCNWSCYTANMSANGASSAQIAATVMQLSFDYNYRLWQAQPGVPLDVPVTVWGWDPYTTMQLRQSYGYTSIPDGRNPDNSSAWVAPGLEPMGNLPQANQPGGIPVSLTSGPWTSVNGACQ